MGAHDQPAITLADHALDWARSRVAFDRTEVVTDAPWATTRRLVRDGESHYLKTVPLHQAHVLASTAALAQRFPQQVPKVIAFDAQRGWLLSAAHGGRTLDYDSPDADIVLLAANYGAMQAAAARELDAFPAMARPDIASLPAQLLRFLSPTDTRSPSAAAHSVNADYFIGSDAAARYHRALQRRLGLLQQHVLAAQQLPPTVNHGDLRPPNAAIDDAGTCVIMDWDDALVGPAGMSLHGLFSGCSVPTILLSGSKAAEAAAGTPNGVLIRAYVDALAQGGYADVATLKRALPASMCAGMMQFMLNFARFPGENGREGVADTLQTRLDDLLDVCDLLASHDAEAALVYAQDYEDHAQWRRAQQLLQDHTLRHPGNAGVLARLGTVQALRGDLPEAEQSWRAALGLAPELASLHAGLGAVLLQRLQTDESARELQHALDLDPALAQARVDLQHVQAIAQMQQAAQQPEKMPILRFEPGEAIATGPTAIRPEMLALGASLFDTYGTLQIDNAFPADAIAKLHDTFIERYTPYFREDDHPDALRLGDKRYMLTVDIEDAFGDAWLIGSPLVLPIIRQVLGDDCVLGAYTAVISLPGSRDQRLHKDHPALFPDTEWHFKLPCFAAQIIIPLVPLDDMTGTTRFYKGTHRIPTEEAEETGAQDPVVPLGSCLLTDYRCAHRGRGNRSEQVRPILTLIFNRRWFRDFKNYAKQPPLRLTDAAYEKMPADLRRLVSWWKEERKHDLLARSLLRQ